MGLNQNMISPDGHSRCWRTWLGSGGLQNLSEPKVEVKGITRKGHNTHTHTYIHPGRLTWNLQITHLEREMIFQTSVIMVHVHLPGCIPLMRPIYLQDLKSAQMLHLTSVETIKMF